MPAFMSSMLVPMLLADAKSAAERAAWEAQRRGVSTYDEQTGICIPGSAICDKNLVIALAVVGFLWLSTCGGVSVIVDLFRGKPAAAAAAAAVPAAAAKKESAADKEGNNAEEKESDDDDDGDDDDDAAAKKKDDDLGAKKKKKATLTAAAAAAAAAKKKEPNAGVAVIVAVMVLGALVWACSSGAGFGGGPSGAVLSEADAKMRARLEAMSQPRGGGGGGGGGAAGGAEAAELAANKAYVKERMAADAEKQKKHAAKAKKPRQPRAKVEYAFTLSMGGGGGLGGAETQTAIKAYADAHELLGHVFMRGGKVEGRVQGREDRVKATQPWLETLAGVQDVAWEDALTHPFKDFEIMKMGH